MRTTAVLLALLATACTSGGSGPADVLLPAAAPTVAPTTLPPVDPPALPPLPSAAATPTETVVTGAGAARSAAPEVGRPGRVLGLVTANGGRALAGIRVMRGDLSAQLATTDEQGRYDVPCGSSLLLSAHPVSGWYVVPGPPAPAISNSAWRRVRPVCGLVARTTLPEGGVVDGYAHTDSPPAEECCYGVTLVRMGTQADGRTRMNPEDGDPSFFTVADPDGHYRVEGLDTGSYWISESVDGFPDQGRFLDVVEGRTTDGDFATYVHVFSCEYDGSC